LDNGSDFYIANRGNNTIVRMRQDGTVIAVRRVTVDAHGPWDNASLNGIATSTDGTTIYVTYTGPGQSPGGVVVLSAIPSGAKMRSAMNCSQVVLFARAITSPAAMYIAF
jgi:DNA-binding beta-propeller fold protein YncE